VVRRVVAIAPGHKLTDFIRDRALRECIC
jgi:hypothetical protein